MLELGPSLGSKFEPDFRLEVNKTKDRARSSLISKSSIELFFWKKMGSIIEIMVFLQLNVGLDKARRHILQGSLKLRLELGLGSFILASTQF